MLSIRAAELLKAMGHIKMVEQSMMQLQVTSKNTAFPIQGLQATLAELSGFITYCGEIGLPVTRAAAENAQRCVLDFLSRERRQVPSALRVGQQEEVVSLSPLECSIFASLAGDTARRLTDELGTRQWLQLDPAVSSLFEQPTPLFGDVVAVNFPSVSYDIEQGGRALAIGLSTAAAFHFLRCLEAGMRALSRNLAIPDPTTGAERNWSSIIKKLREEVQRRWPVSTGRMDGDARFFDEVMAALASMANPWRNATMHLDQKYTADEARRIMVAVHGFLEKLARRIDENGEAVP